MSRLLGIMAAVLVGSAAVSTVHAEVSQGDRVRITRVGGVRLIGYLEASDAAEVKLRTDEQTNLMTIPMKEVTMAEVSLGMRGHATQGAVIGGVVGLLLGYVAAVVVWAPRRGSFRGSGNMN